MEDTTQSEKLEKREADRKRMAIDYFRLVESGKFKEGLRFFSPDCMTHNPYIAGDMKTLTEGMIEANKKGTSEYPNAKFTVRQVLADGDYVAVHTELLNNKSKPSEGGLRQIHLFRFEDDKIVEYWDVTQQVMQDMPNAAAAF